MTTNRYTIGRFVFASFLIRNKPHSNSSLVGQWRLIPYSYDTSDIKKYFDFGSSKLVITTVYQIQPRILKREIQFFQKAGPIQMITTIINLINRDTAIVRNRHGVEDFYILRER